MSFRPGGQENNARTVTDAGSIKACHNVEAIAKKRTFQVEGAAHAMHVG